MKPMIKYRGGKSRELPQLLGFIPRFKGRYIEPFFGGGALFFHLEPRMSIISDINAKLMKFYIGVRDDYMRLREELDEIESIYRQNRLEFEHEKAERPTERVMDNNETLYYRLRAQFNDLEPKVYSEAALYFYINKTAYSGMIRYNSKGEFNVPFGRYPNLNTDVITAGHSLLLQRATIMCADYSEVFAMCNEDDFIFLDPPYDCTFSDYGNQEYRDGFNSDEHHRLAKAFYDLPCKALMVIGRTPLIEELYGNDIIYEYPKQYAVNIRNRFKSSANHVLIANYRKEELLQDTISYPEKIEILQPTLFEPKTKYGKKD
ncbi:MAG: Dam family site-specific DNA-(adenine-N6)-methyltransferase [Muribaculaceae bacterium]|nr:Dam family site-specific DNA-(adenine-N6)-methyltransferase [Muribaculaceae bacterium]